MEVSDARYHRLCSVTAVYSDLNAVLATICAQRLRCAGAALVLVDNEQQENFYSTLVPSIFCYRLHGEQDGAADPLNKLLNRQKIIVRQPPPIQGDGDFCAQTLLILHGCVQYVSKLKQVREILLVGRRFLLDVLVVIPNEFSTIGNMRILRINSDCLCVDASIWNNSSSSLKEFFSGFGSSPSLVGSSNNAYLLCDRKTKPKPSWCWRVADMNLISRFALFSLAFTSCNWQMWALYYSHSARSGPHLRFDHSESSVWLWQQCLLLPFCSHHRPRQQLNAENRMSLVTTKWRRLAYRKRIERWLPLPRSLVRIIFAFSTAPCPLLCGSQKLSVDRFPLNWLAMSV